MTAASLLASLRDLKVQSYRGQPAPYQFVVLLYAIDRANTDKPRIARFSEVKDELGRALAPFALAKTPPNPANPWVALGQSPWWELEATVPYKLVAERDLAAGLSVVAYDLVRDDPAFTGQAVDVITRIIGSHPAYPSLLESLSVH
ncbi:hypothetical protein [Rhodococcus tukisamuensis]|uniref:ScoMcrA-like DNA sulfur-binding domain-containing protein n=1 Tax=Rhodococcus tukisamuensis TaxID=168276 RepID=A0A1G7B932_9NOCA|nr:hypothetical protein [Rhodococcus tukisamuensis]SDE22755.1 hypothetical protein SAMN05444580_112101 [Rhodococcus tukisamuensis]